MTDLARSQIAGAIGVPAAAPITTLFDQQRQHHQSFMKQLQSRTDTDSSRSEVSAAWTRTEEPPSSLDSRSDSIPSRRPTLRYWVFHTLERLTDTRGLSLLAYLTWSHL